MSKQGSRQYDIEKNQRIYYIYRRSFPRRFHLFDKFVIVINIINNEINYLKKVINITIYCYYKVL